MHVNSVGKVEELIVPTRNFWKFNVAAGYPEVSEEVRLAWVVTLVEKENALPHRVDVFVDSGSGTVIEHAIFN